MLDQRNQSISHLEEDSSSLLDLLTEGTIRLDGEFLARYGWVRGEVDVVNFEDIVFGVFAVVQWLRTWDWKVRIEGGGV